ncbi:MAG: aconitase X catalytic domain-containing protein [Alphaproteobacteria bacterium]|nr:aconitase X catalytic domain-containing protein [Alphaproteobacteria bacterium]
MLQLSATERAMAEGAAGPARAMALRIVADTARMLGANRLVPIASAHIDGCLYHGDSGTLFAERLVAEGGAVAVPTTLNVGALDLLHAGRVRLEPPREAMARRMMDAYRALGCLATWTCAPYQAGHRPALGQHVAWGESNAVVFCNSVLGARTERYGDFLDICAALCARAPETGLHLAANRRAALAVDCSALDAALVREEAFWPVLGAWLGMVAGARVAVFMGLPAAAIEEDRLKAMGAAAASTGAVGLFHIEGVTPEDPAVMPGHDSLSLVPAMLHEARDRLSTTVVRVGEAVDAVAVGSPHFSLKEFRRLFGLLAGRKPAIPFYVCTGRHTLDALQAEGLAPVLADSGLTVVADTCIVVTPILPPSGGLLLTNSGKFAHYVRPNTGRDVLYGSLGDCVATAVAGRLVRDEGLWR